MLLLCTLFESACEEDLPQHICMTVLCTMQQYWCQLALSVLQCAVVEEACIQQPDIPGQISLKSETADEALAAQPAQKATVERLVAKPWISKTPEIVAEVFKELLHPDNCKTSLSRDALDHPSCGTLCQLQVCDHCCCYSCNAALYIGSP